MHCFVIFNQRSWREEGLEDGDNIRHAPPPLSKDWRPRLTDSENCECKAQAEENEPSGWWGCQVKSIHRAGGVICAFIQFDGWGEDHNELLELEYLRPKNRGKPICSKFVIEQVIDVPNYANHLVCDENFMLLAKKRLISLYYRKQDSKLVFVGTPKLVHLTSNLIKLHFGKEQEKENEKEKEKHGDDEQSELAKKGLGPLAIPQEKKKMETTSLTELRLIQEHINDVKRDQLSIIDDIDDAMKEIIEIEQMLTNWNLNGNSNVILNGRRLAMHLSNMKNKLSETRIKCKKMNSDECNFKSLKLQFETLNNEIRNSNNYNRREYPISLVVELKRLEQQVKLQHQTVEVCELKI